MACVCPWDYFFKSLLPQRREGFGWITAEALRTRRGKFEIENLCVLCASAVNPAFHICLRLCRAWCFREYSVYSKMSQTLGMLVDAVVEEGDVLGVGQTTIFRAPARPVPGITVLQQALKDHSRDLTMSHEAIQVFVQIGVFVHL